MARVEQKYTYVCDGCGTRQENPYDWRTFMFVGSGTTWVSSAQTTSEDYCTGCVKKMRQAVRGLE